MGRTCFQWTNCDAKYCDKLHITLFYNCIRFAAFKEILYSQVMHFFKMTMMMMMIMMMMMF